MSNVSDLMGLGMAPGLAQKVVDIATGEVSDVTWDSLQGKPSTFPPTIGTTSNTAKAGNYTPSVSELGVSQTVQNFLNAQDMDGCQSQIGGTSTGKLVFTAATPAAACSAIQAMQAGAAPTGSVRGGVLQQAAIPALTDSSGGTSGGNTVPSVPAATAATTDTTAASLTSTNAAITALKNDVATLAAKVNTLITELKASGVTA
jgi:hypothetical protein